MGVYRRDKHFSSFIGFFPADDPELCVAVFLDEPKNGYYGGEAAAPIFHDIAERSAQVPGHSVGHAAGIFVQRIGQRRSRPSRLSSKLM